MPGIAAIFKLVRFDRHLEDVGFHWTSPTELPIPYYRMFGEPKRQTVHRSAVKLQSAYTESANAIHVAQYAALVARPASSDGNHLPHMRLPDNKPTSRTTMANDQQR